MGRYIVLYIPGWQECSVCVCVRMGCVSNVGLTHVGDSPGGKAMPLLLRASCAALPLRHTHGRCAP